MDNLSSNTLVITAKQKCEACLESSEQNWVRMVDPRSDEKSLESFVWGSNNLKFESGRDFLTINGTDNSRETKTGTEETGEDIFLRW